MAMEHDEQTGKEKKPTEFEIEEVGDAGLEQVSGGMCAVATESCGGACKAPLNQDA